MSSHEQKHYYDDPNESALKLMLTSLARFTATFVWNHLPDRVREPIEGLQTLRQESKVARSREQLGLNPRYLADPDSVTKVIRKDREKIPALLAESLTELASQLNRGNMHPCDDETLATTPLVKNIMDQQQDTAYDFDAQFTQAQGDPQKLYQLAVDVQNFIYGHKSFRGGFEPAQLHVYLERRLTKLVGQIYVAVAEHYQNQGNTSVAHKIYLETIQFLAKRVNQSFTFWPTEAVEQLVQVLPIVGYQGEAQQLQNLIEGTSEFGITIEHVKAISEKELQELGAAPTKAEIADIRAVMSQLVAEMLKDQPPRSTLEVNQLIEELVRIHFSSDSDQRHFYTATNASQILADLQRMHNFFVESTQYGRSGMQVAEEIDSTASEWVFYYKYCDQTKWGQTLFSYLWRVRMSRPKPNQN